MRILSFLSFCLSTSAILEKPIKPITTKFCKNCKHFRQSWSWLPLIDLTMKYADCLANPREISSDVKIHYMVSGKMLEESEFYSCTTSREIKSMCGENATKYEEK